MTSVWHDYHSDPEDIRQKLHPRTRPELANSLPRDVITAVGSRHVRPVSRLAAVSDVIGVRSAAVWAPGVVTSSQGEGSHLGQVVTVPAPGQPL